MSASHSFNADSLAKSIDEAVRLQLNREVVLIQTALVKMLSKKGSGIKYRGGRKGKGSWRTRSAPGQPPAVDTGDLRRSVQVAVPQELSLGTTVRSAYLTNFREYGWILEAGSSRVAARPWIAPSLAGKAEGVKTRLERAVARAIAANRSPAR